MLNKLCFAEEGANVVVTDIVAMVEEAIDIYGSLDFAHNNAAGAGTEMVRLADVPMNRLADPEEMAGAAVWLCSDDASYVTGHPLSVDGGSMAGN